MASQSRQTPNYDQILLAYRDLADLPTPIPLDLTDFPIVLAMRRLPARRADGTLPEYAYLVRTTIVDASGTTYELIAEGSPKLGLPHGFDLDVLVALFRIVDEERYLDGHFPAPSITRICQAMGKPWHSDLADRIREALERFFHTRITVRRTEVTSQLALEMPRGRAGTGGIVKPEGQVLQTEGVKNYHILHYDWDKVTRGNSTDEVIRTLRIYEYWIQQARTRWVAWIDMPLLVSLDGVISKRLYHFLAGYAARRQTSPDDVWSFSTQAIRSALGIDPQLKPNKARDRILEALNELHEKDIVTKPGIGEDRRGSYSVTFGPGKHLRLAGTMFGLGLDDLRSARIQYSLLEHFGMSPQAARQLVETRPEQTYETLCYAIYLRERHPGKIKTNLPGYIRKCIEDDVSFGWDDEYLAWRKRPTLKRADVAPQPELMATAATPQGRTIPVAEVTDADPAAIALWATILPAIIDRTSGLNRPAAEHLAPARLDDDMLTCVATNEWFATIAARNLASLAEAILAEHGGPVRRWQVLRRLDDGRLIEVPIRPILP